MIKIVLFVIITVFFGCGTVPQPHDPSDANNWIIHRASVSPYDRWQAFAKIAIQTPQYSGSVRLDWKQINNDFSIILSGPLGIQNVLLTGDNDEAILQYNGERKVGSPSELVNDIVGIPFKFDVLTYWLRGIPSPHLIQTNLFIYPDGQAYKFEQAGWSLKFENYKPTPFGSLPRKILGYKNEQSFKLVVTKWSKIKI